jgi:hypothetical protein
MKLRKKLNRLYWQWHNSDSMRYFHLHPKSKEFCNALKNGVKMTGLYASVIVAISMTYSQEINWLGFTLTLPLAFLVGALMGWEE